MHRTSRAAPIAALLLSLLVTATEPTVTATTGPIVATAAETVRVDLLDAPLPADEPEAARQVLTCGLSDVELCDELTELLLELPFAWHRTGYTVELADGADARTYEGYRVTGLARAQSREVVVYVHWADTVKDLDGAFRGIRRSLAHELGHVMHQTCGEDTVLDAWRTARDIPAHVPLRGHGEGMFSSVSEDFADTMMTRLTDGEFAGRSSIERERFRPGLPGSDGAAHRDGPGARR